MRRMRWTYDSGNSEIRDGLDAAWWRLLAACLPQAVCVPVPNAVRNADRLLRALPFSGFILTGGDDWEAFPERDETETMMLAYAKKQGLPLLGICRGAQVLCQLLGGSQTDVDGHAGTRHEIFTCSGESRSVNSYHRHGISKPGAGMTVTAQDAEGNVEAFTCCDGLIRGIMWHPERETAPDRRDMELIAQMFGRERI